VTRPLVNQVAVVTGAARGLGREHARTLSQAGAAVVLVDVRRTELERAAEQLPRAIAVTADVTQRDDVDEVVTRALDGFGGIDILVNNAGGTVRSGDGVDDEEGWRKTVDLNLTATWRMCRAVSAYMRERGGGRIVNTASNTVFRPPGDVAASYIAAKAGVIGLTRALAREWGPWNITVNAVAPGLTLHEGLQLHRRASELEAMSARAIGEQCLPRASTPADISGAVLFLVSPDGRFVTGQVLTVDGGWTFA